SVLRRARPAERGQPEDRADRVVSGRHDPGSDSGARAAGADPSAAVPASAADHLAGEPDVDPPLRAQPARADPGRAVPRRRRARSLDPLRADRRAADHRRARAAALPRSRPRSADPRADRAGRVSPGGRVMAPPTVPTSPGLGARLLAEFDALRELWSLGMLLWFVLVIAIAWTLASGGPALIRTAWRLGLDSRRRLGLLASGLRILGLLVGFAGVLRPVLDRAPTLGVGALVIAIALAGVVAPMQLRNLASGLSLATRTRLREGDLVTIGAIEG